MSSRRLFTAASLLTILSAIACVGAGDAPVNQADQLSPVSLARGERVLLMVPHPDDEVICCSGLMARILAEEGSVHLVYATHGDGYREGVAAVTHEGSPGPETFRAYGERRREESLAVLSQLRVPASHARFLGFPDGGLRALWDHRFDDARPYRSLTTAADTPPYAVSPARGRPYTAREFEHDLSRAIAETRPTLLVIPDPRDEHGDHAALGLFSLDALPTDALATQPPVRILTYLVHWETWPEPGTDSSAPLAPPQNFEPGVHGWQVLPLTPAAAAEKRRLLHLYATQMHAMGGFLERFPRRNELFGERDATAPRFVSERGLGSRPRNTP